MSGLNMTPARERLLRAIAGGNPDNGFPLRTDTLPFYAKIRDVNFYRVLNSLFDAGLAERTHPLSEFIQLTPAGKKVAESLNASCMKEGSNAN